jgi:transcription elongation factor Elf1
MARRKKAAKKVIKKKKYTVAKVFKCIFCNHDKSVTCALDTKTMTGQLVCSICEAKFETKINSLTDPVDVFTEWLDETSENQVKATQSLNREEEEVDELDADPNIFDDDE